MATEIGPYAVRRSIWIDAAPARVWEEFETFERMVEWYGTGHTLVKYEPFTGGMVETDAAVIRTAVTPSGSRGACSCSIRRASSRSNRNGWATAGSRPP